ncbi:hypothetical protein ENBRE01_0739 [Enteropsectra breve]|nr:hypothetical protein ENBRE01_0739 [Enteropsectra breve]
MGEFGKSFEKLYREKYAMLLNKIELRESAQAMEEENMLFSECIPLCSPPKTDYPIILGNSLTRISITNIGSFPPYKYTNKIIYPVNYTCKKRGKHHINYKKNTKEKALYICKITAKGIEIAADDGYVWSGEDVWRKFTEDLNGFDEYSSVEDFMGLTHPNVTKMIEEIGDISKFNGYVPFAQRQIQGHSL